MTSLWVDSSWKPCNDKHDFLKLYEDTVDVDGLRGHSKKLFLQRATSSVRKNTLSIRIVKIWNALPEDTVTASSTDSFKNKLDAIMEKQDIYYDDFKAEVDLNQRM